MTDAYSGPTHPAEPLGSSTGGPVPVYPAHSAGTTTSYSTTDDGSQDSGLKDTAKDEAANVAATARDGASRVIDSEKIMVKETAGEAKTAAKDTIAEAKVAAKDLLDQSRTELSSGATQQVQKLAGTVRTFSEDLTSMADGTEGQGLARDLARQASSYLADASDWLENREPADLLNDVSGYARRNPGTFLAIAAGVGLVVGRVARGFKDDAAEEKAATSTEPQHASSSLSGHTPAGYVPASYAPGTLEDTAPGADTGASTDPLGTYATPATPTTATDGYGQSGDTTYDQYGGGLR